MPVCEDIFKISNQNFIKNLMHIKQSFQINGALHLELVSKMRDNILETF